MNSPRGLGRVALLLLASGCTDPSYGELPEADAGRREASEPPPTTYAPSIPEAGVRPVSAVDATTSHAAPANAAPSDAAALDATVPDATLAIEASMPAEPAPVTPPADAAVAPAAAPAWWAALPEHYGVRIRFYGHDRLTGNAVWLSHEILMLAHLTPNADGDLNMELRRCSDDGYMDSDALPLSDHWQWQRASQLAPEQHRLVLRDGKIRSEAPPRPLGYRAEPACSPGAQLSFPDRSWLPNGVCNCGADELPMLATDCRVIDADGDGRPGLTVRHGDGSLEDVRAKDACQIVDGTLDGTRIRASYVENYDYLGLSCVGVCRHNDIVVCPLPLNDVLFEPLPAASASGAWSCEALLREHEAGKLFPSSMVTFPPSCTI